MKGYVFALAVGLLAVAAMVVPPQAEAHGFGFRRNAVVVQGGGAQVVSVRGGVFGPRVQVINGGGFVAPAAVGVRSFGAPVILNSGYGVGVQSFGVGSSVILSNGYGGVVAPARVLVIP